MRTQVVPKQQCIALIRIAVDTYMHIGATLSVWLTKSKLRPQRGIVVLAKRHMIVGECFEPIVSGVDKPLLDFLSEHSNGHLNIDDVFGTQTRNRRRSNMIDAQG